MLNSSEATSRASSTGRGRCTDPKALWMQSFQRKQLSFNQRCHHVLLDSSCHPIFFFLLLRDSQSIVSYFRDVWKNIRHYFLNLLGRRKRVILMKDTRSKVDKLQQGITYSTSSIFPVISNAGFNTQNGPCSHFWHSTEFEMKEFFFLLKWNFHRVKCKDLKHLRKLMSTDKCTDKLWVLINV